MSDDAILEMRAITKEFPGVKALSGVDLAVRRGEVHAICGENGAGKSTLMNVLSGVYPHGSYAGDIVYDGEVCAFHRIADSERSGIVIIHQELALSPYLTLAENVFIGNERASRGWISWNRTENEAVTYLRRVGLHDNPATKAIDVGVGKQQLVEIAKALAKDVRLLILDEPTAALNDDDSAHLLDLILDLKAEGVTCILISHKLNEIKKVADRVTIIRDGRTIETLDREEITEERIIRGMVGRDLTSRYPDRTPKIGPELLRIEDWTVHHPLDRSRVVVDHANLKVHEGEVVGIAGLMGAGRTELAMSVFGRSWGTDISGNAYKRGEPINVRTVQAAVRNGLAYATEDRKQFGLNLIDDIARNVRLGFGCGHACMRRRDVRRDRRRIDLGRSRCVDGDRCRRLDGVEQAGGHRCRGAGRCGVLGRHHGGGGDRIPVLARDARSARSCARARRLGLA